MLNLKKVAVTGGLSCGKSSVCRIFKELGAYITSADEIVHQLLSPQNKFGQEVIKIFGDKILVNDQIDRSLISAVVFDNPKLLQTLEDALHPEVYKKIEEEMEKCKSLSFPLFVAEIPLLFETKKEHDFDYTVSVVANLEICLKRFVESTGYNQNEFEKRMARQYSPLKKAIESDYVIMNNGTPTDLQEITKELYQELIFSIL